MFDYFTPTTICTPVFDYFTPATILLLYLTTLHLQPFYSCIWLLYTHNHFTHVFDYFTPTSICTPVFDYFTPTTILLLYLTTLHLQPFYSCIWLMYLTTFHLQPFVLMYLTTLHLQPFLLLYLTTKTPTTIFTPVFWLHTCNHFTPVFKYILFTYNHVYSCIWLTYTCNHLTHVLDYFTLCDWFSVGIPTKSRKHLSVPLQQHSN